jgi:hypothetical protein
VTKYVLEKPTLQGRRGRTPWLLRLASIRKPSARRSLGLAVPARSEANSAGSVEFGLGALVAAEFLTSLDGDRCFYKEVGKSYESLKVQLKEQKSSLHLSESSEHSSSSGSVLSSRKHRYSDEASDTSSPSFYQSAGCSRIFRTWLIFLVDFHSVEALLKCYKFKFKILKS